MLIDTQNIIQTILLYRKHDVTIQSSSSSVLICPNHHAIWWGCFYCFLFSQHWCMVTSFMYWLILALAWNGSVHTSLHSSGINWTEQTQQKFPLYSEKETSGGLCALTFTLYLSCLYAPPTMNLISSFECSLYGL